MIFSEIKLFGLLALSYSLIACGQTPVSNAPNATSGATPNAIAQPTVAAQPTKIPVAVAKSPEPQSTNGQAPILQSQGSSAKATTAQQPTNVDNAPAIAQSSEESFSSKGFIMPSKNIYCVVYGDRLRCEIVSRLNPMPPQPESCNLDWGSGLYLRKVGKPNVICAGDTAYSPDYKTLDYSKTWSKDGFVCESRTDGLNCTNPRGNGFFLNREEWKIF
jgi:hypothetical protein